MLCVNLTNLHQIADDHFTLLDILVVVLLPFL